MILALLTVGCVPDPPKPAHESADDTAGSTRDTTDTHESSSTTADDSSSDSAPPPDADGDGYDETADCDDANPDVSPAATEACNGVDDDCDELVDEGDLYPDRDGDGYGDSDVQGTLCEGADEVEDAGDCDDTDATVYPGATEECGWVDTNCDGERPCDLEDEALWTWEETYEHGDGSSVALGDVNGDGLDDLLIGGAAGQHDEFSLGDPEGQVHILLSDAARGAETLDLTDDADWTLIGDDEDILTGGYYSIDAARFLPDLTGDGLPELFVGARGGDHAWLVTSASLLAAPSTALISEVADQELADPSSTSEITGRSVSDAGDMDGDGTLDLAVGGHEAVWIVPYDASATRVDLRDGAELSGDSEFFGTTLVGAGDVDGDGVDDLLVGDWRADEGAELSGLACLYLGGTLVWGDVVTDDDAELRLVGEFHSEVGYSLAAADVDGDGYADLVVGAAAPVVEDGGAYIFYAASDRLGTTLGLGDASASATGQSPKSMSFGDFDGDGAEDLAIDARSTTDDSAVFVLQNQSVPRTGSEDAGVSGLTIRTDDEAIDIFGTMRMDGDLTGDGLDDLLVPADYWPSAATPRGAAWLIPGREG